MKLLLLIVWLAAALATPAVAWAGDQAYISWTLGDQDGRPTVTWKITGSTKWYVGAIQIASDRRVTASGHFLPENVVAYEVLEPDRAPGFWVGPVALQPGTYYGRLRLRFDGPCSANCQSATSVRSFRIDPPRLRGLRWKARGGVGRVIVSWTKPRNGWYVSMVVVDDNRAFSSPEDAVAWPNAPTRTRWASTLLSRDRYHVRLRVRHARCESCVWTSPAKIVDVKRANSPPTLKPARFELARRDAKTRRHTWKATFIACDQTRGAAPAADPRGDRAHRRQCPADSDAQSAPRRAGWMPLLHDHEAVCLPVPAGEVRAGHDPGPRRARRLEPQDAQVRLDDDRLVPDARAGASPGSRRGPAWRLSLLRRLPGAGSGQAARRRPRRRARSRSRRDSRCRRSRS